MKITQSPKAEKEIIETFRNDFNPISNKKYMKELENKKGKELEKSLKKINKENRNNINKKIKSIKGDYDKLENIYTKELEKIMGRKIKNKKTAYLTPLIMGIADVITRKRFFINHELENDLFKYVFFHELTHLHYADIIKKDGNKKEFTSPFMEGIAHLIIFKTDIKKVLNIKIKYNRIHFIKKNKKFMEQLEKEWNKKKTFKDFVNKVTKISTKGVIIC
jgi:hypothetical protein